MRSRRASVTLCNTLLQSATLGGMAWNVVIAGGGFGGAMAARELERIDAAAVGAADARQRRQLHALHAVPAGGGGGDAGAAARGHAAARDPRAHLPAARRDRSPTTRRAARSQLRTHDGETEELPYDQLLLALGSVSRVLPVPGLAEHAIGFKSLADAIWLRNHVIETLEAANATEDPARRDELLTYVFVGGGYAGLEALAELQDFAADAIESYPRARLHGMRWVLVEAADRVLPEIDAELADYALRELRGRGIDIRLGTTLEEVTADSARLSTGETLPTRTVVWTAGVAPAPEPARAHRCRSTSAAASRSTSTCGSRAWTRSGRSATAPRPPTRAAALCPPTAQHAVRQGPVAARNIAAELGDRRGRGRSTTAATPPSSTSAATRRSAGSAAAPSAASRPGGWRAPTT